MKQNVGFRVFMNISRPPRELVEKFRGIPSSNINDNLNRLYCMKHEIRPFNHHFLLGTAITVKAPMGDNAVLHKALDIAQPGDVIVVDGAGALERALMGEIMIAYGAGKGIAGFVVDGAIRDADGARDAAVPVYAAGISPQGPYKNGPGEVNVPIACGGQVVFPGDIIVGDSDGIVVVRPDYAEELAAESLKKLAGEEQKLKQMYNGIIDTEEHSSRYDKIILSRGVQIID